LSSDPPHTQSHSQPGAGEHTMSAMPSVGPLPATHHDISTVLAREPCAGCGAPLGADQRYCLSCGIPRSGTRLPFLDVLHTEAAAAGVVEAGSQPASLLRIAAAPAGRPGFTDTTTGWSGRDPDSSVAARLRRYTPLFALLSVLLLALLIGLELGHWASGSGSSAASIPARQVVEIKGLTLPTTTPTASAPTAPAAASTTPSSTPSSSDKAASQPASHASNPTVGKLAQSTGKEHAKEVEKALAKEGGVLSTGGAPPPKAKTKSKSQANQPIGGGSEVTSIE
jgi:hypothetical protein